MIKFNNSDIIDWNFDDNDIIKVYHNGAIVFYKFDSEQGGYKVCYAVVDDITQYPETEFEDVFDKATEKWYKLNNLNQYEEYGVYASGRTSCEGSASRLPQGYTEVEYVENTSTAYIDTGFKPNQNTKILITTQCVTSTSGGRQIGAGGYDKTNAIQFDYESGAQGTLHISWGTTAGWTTYSSCVGDYNKHTYEWDGNVFYRDKGEQNQFSATTAYGTYQCTDNLGIFTRYQNGSGGGSSECFRGKVFDFKMYDNGTLIRDLVPAKRDSDNKYGMYDLINDVFYTSPNGNNFIGGEPVTPTDCVTTYEGKLTIDNDYEYEWNGSSWVNLGEVSGSSRVPTGYVELTYAQTIKQQVSTSSAFTVPIDLQTYYNYIFEFTPIDWEGNNGSYYGILLGGNDGGTVYPKYGLFKFDNGWGTMWRRFSTVFWNYNLENRSSGGAVDKYRVYDNVRAKFKLHLHNYDASQGADLTVENEGYEASAATSTKILRSNYTVSTGTYNLPLFSTVDGNLAQTAYIKCHELKVETSGGTAVYDYIPCKRESDNKVGLYDIVNNQFYAPLFTLVAGDEASHTVYPKYYSEKSEPLDNLTFNTLAEAQAYAEANCVYDGMHATIGADRYYFDSSDENGWVKILEYYKVEDVTSGGASGWTITGSSTYNPQPSYYDDFSVALNSSYQTKVAKVTIYGYENFTYYLRSTGYSNYAYATSSNVDELTSDPTSMSYSSSSAITNTYNFNKAAGSAVNLSNYRRVTYNNLDKTVEHTFYVVFYNGYYYSPYPPSATLLIPKEQDNENWEQVTFSASSNVASAQKSLYIDGNYSTSGGTQSWYYRWMVGLPSGSHTSYTNYSNYDYCPNVTSSTFTSVAGEQRQVNFTYNNTTNKTLSFRLTDGSNVLTPSNTVYYNMTYYNSCGASSSTSNVTFPRSQSVKVGGRFRFANSSNRHYIYGYSPNILLNTDYYVNNYQSTFDITYTKLSEEAVTITYTTYDPSDTEVPAFKTNITWPYNGGTTSSTTLTSYAVPYTYPYEVSQTNDKFSADSQTYTAGQSSRTINFVLYPNNREFATVADMEAYQYAWEGMRAYVGDTNYEYKNGEWVEYSGTIWLDPSATNALFSIGHYWGENYKMVFTTYLSGSYRGDFGSFWQYNEHSPIELSFYSNGFYYDFHNPTSTTAPNVYTGDYSWRIMKNSSLSNYQNGQILNVILSNGAVRVELESTGTAIVTGSTSVTAQNWYSGLYQANVGLNNSNAKCHLSHIQIYNGNNELVNDFKFIKNNGVVGSQEISIYDSITNTTYNNTNSNTPVYHIET